MNTFRRVLPCSKHFHDAPYSVGSGVALALPALECMTPIQAARESRANEPRRMVAICFELSFHPPNLIPEKAGPRLRLTVIFAAVERRLRDDFTIISGTSHPDVDGGHAASKSWLTGAPHPGAANFQNSISIDQLAAREIGLQTRFSYLSLGQRWNLRVTQWCADTGQHVSGEAV